MRFGDTVSLADLMLGPHFNFFARQELTAHAPVARLNVARAIKPAIWTRVAELAAAKLSGSPKPQRPYIEFA